MGFQLSLNPLVELPDVNLKFEAELPTGRSCVITNRCWLGG